MANKPTVINEYFAYQEKYTKQFGSKTIVLMQVGSFYESYATDKLGYNLDEISILLNVVRTKKNTKDEELSERNPYMLGFPTISLIERLKTLTENGYTVIVVDQISLPPDVKRKVMGIYSPGTNINACSTETNYIVVVYIKDEPQKNGSSLTVTGMSSIDVTTGKCCLHEAFSYQNDEKFGLDEASRFIHSLFPKEIIIYSHNSQFTEEFLLSYLGIENTFYKFYDTINPHFIKLSYQNETLKKIYDCESIVSPIEFLNLEKYTYALISFMLLLDYIHQHNEDMLKYIDKPQPFFDNQKLILGNDALTQLNVFPANDNELKKKTIDCLFNVINCTTTSLGKRYLRNMLCFPSVCSNNIQKSYQCINLFLNDQKFESFIEILKCINDVERLVRKVNLKILQPNDLLVLIQSYENFCKIDKKIKKLKMMKEINHLFNSHYDIDKLEKFINYFETTFTRESLKKYTTSDDKNSYFQLGIYRDIDELQEKINTNMNYMELVRSKLAVLTGSGEDSITIKKNDRDGYYLSLTKLRSLNVQKKLEKITKLELKNLISIPVKSLIFKENPKGNSKIIIPELESKSDDIVSLRKKLNDIINQHYLQELEKINKKYEKTFKCVNNFIAELDFYLSNAKIAYSYGYCQPIIDNKNDNSYIQCTQLRHPIIEKLVEYEYIPHDIHIGSSDMKGMLIYGLNASGKCLSPETLILMFDGTTKQARNINIGDQLMGDDSTPRNVLEMTSGVDLIYKIELETGESFKCNGNHILCLKDPSKNKIIEMSLNDYLSIDYVDKHHLRMYKMNVDFPKKFIPENPQIFEELVNKIVTNELYSIPSNYMYNTYSVRLSLLSEIFKNCSHSIESSNKNLVDQIIYLIDSVGLVYHLKKVKIKNTDMLNFILTLEHTHIFEFSFIIHLPTYGPYIGFELDQNHRFLLGNFIVSHNSSLMKAVGLSVIMAQAGMYVPAKTFKYTPYSALFTRISGNDNLFKGLSSFGLEMMELKAILRRSDKKTLVIGDEVCRGTEHISGNAIVASSLIQLSKKESTFIFATHLHEIPELPQIKQIKNIKTFHLSVKYDQKTDNLIFDRQLKDGPGEKIYGITVAKYIINDNEFIQLSTEIKNELLGQSNHIVTTHTSKYNANTYIHQCNICGQLSDKNYFNLDTHHINQQKDCSHNHVKNKPYMGKNSLANLIVLCKTCHQKLHKGKIIIRKYMMTTGGKKLDIAKIK